MKWTGQKPGYRGSGAKRRKAARLTAALVAGALVAAAWPLDAARDGAANAAAAATTASNNQLVRSLQTELDHVWNEDTGQGRRMVVAINVKNPSGHTVRLPGDTVRMRMNDGTEYNVLPATGNVKAVPPQSTVNLQFSCAVKTERTIRPAKLLWIAIDEYVYPKKETVRLSVPLPKQSIWEQQPLQWGKTFQLPGRKAQLSYTPLSFERFTAPLAPEEGESRSKEVRVAHIVTMQIVNRGSGKEMIPDLVVQGRTSDLSFSGSRMEQGALSLLPGEKRTVRYVMETPEDTQLKTFYILTPETFMLEGGDPNNPLSYSVGRIGFALPEQPQGSYFGAALPYNWGAPIVLDAVSKLLPDGMTMSVVTGVATADKASGMSAVQLKFRLDNKSRKTAQLPVFQTELVARDGKRYSGMRHTAPFEQLPPGMGGMLVFTYALPKGTPTEGLVLNIIDGERMAPYTSTAASYKLPLHTAERGEPPAPAEVPSVRQGEQQFSLYPYQLTVKKAEFDTFYESPVTQETVYTLLSSMRLRLRLETALEKTAELLAAPELANLQFELTDRSGKLLGTQTLNLATTRQTTDGIRDVTFSGVNLLEVQNPLTVNVYETFETTYGTMKRYLGQFIR
ncbi:hypothetical protein [Paenibacillus sp. GCM10027626]|uniref:hypothetical protein n=1 Tax=Paenibacillus sp. GCM10027626 TaxID=3273411 RepID=UPI003643E422